MSRHVVAAMIATTLLAVLAFGVPLALVVESRARDDEVDRLQRLASASTVAVPADGGLDGSVRLPTAEDGVELAVYDGRGERVAGSGPPSADRAVSAVLASGSISTAVGADALVAVVPVNTDGHTVAVVRAAESEDVTNGRVRRTWAGMAGIAALATAAAIALGLFLVRRLVRPLHRLRDDARRLGEGDFSIDHEPSGVVEIDEAGDALEATAGRLAGLVERERAFSADASHQLRTPVAGLRTVLEAELEHPRADPGIALRDALGQVDRLEATMNELLALARDAHPAGPFEVDGFLEDVAERWEAAVRSAGRELVVRTPAEPLDVDASPVAMRQVVDVLVDNALQHGQGAITIDAGGRAEGTALSLRVSDEGDGITGEPETIFHRRQPDAAGHGIGLSLARSLTEAEGGRLRVTRLRPLEFTAVVPAHRRSEVVSG